MDSKKIAVAMSGGVDSSTAAALLREQGYEVVGLSMQLWNQTRAESNITSEEASSNKPGGCCSLDDIHDARRVAGFLNIPYYVINLEEAFEKEVVKPFVQSYLAGETPIPCIPCNSIMKFNYLLNKSKQIGINTIATGHYVRLRYNQDSKRYELLKAVDASKDQSYFLFELSQEQLSHVAFPLGEYTKSEIRKLAQKFQLPVSEKPESQEICFIPDNDYASFIENYYKQNFSAKEWEELFNKKGEIITTDGTILGYHQGFHKYTIGQRKGLGVAVGEPLYVLKTDKINNRVIVGRDQELLKNGLIAHHLNWIAIDELTQPIKVKAKIRNRHEAASGTLYKEDDQQVRLRFDEPQRAVTPGQAAVFYIDDLVIGGGWIKESW